MRRSTQLTRRGMLGATGRAVLAWPLGGCLVRGAEASAGQEPSNGQPPGRQIEGVLWDRILKAWFPRCLDTGRGGFHERFARDWTRQPADSKFIVFQARMTWTPAAVAVEHPRSRDRMLAYARHGLSFLADRMWDRLHGGFLERVDDQGRPHADWPPWKQIYGQAFGIYAAAGAYRATGERRALRLAIDAFRWLDRRAHDAEHGGFFELLTAEGRPVALHPPDQATLRRFPVIGRVGRKSMNAHIHVLEALTALRRVWEDPLLEERLDEVFRIVRDKIVRPPGHLAMFSGRDFTPEEERSSFGHELETAYLLLEAEELLGRREARTRQVARRLVDHSLRYGWDERHGGFFDEGPPQAPPEIRHKVWWAQPEGMNGLLSIHRATGHQDPDYRLAFERTWTFFRDRFVDHRHGGCFEVVEEGGRPLPGKTAKATPWKAAYHVVRGLLHAVNVLRREG